MIIHVKIHYNKIKQIFFNFHVYHDNDGHFENDKP